MSSTAAVKQKEKPAEPTNGNTRPSPWEMWTNYKVTLDFTTGLFASTPASEKLIEDWVNNRMPDVKPPSAKSVNEIKEEVYNSVRTEALKTTEEKELEEIEQQSKSLLVFQRENGVLVMRASTIRSHMKDCATILSARFVGKVKGFPSFATLIKNCVYHDEKQYFIPILQQANDEPFTKPTDTKTKPVHSIVWMGGQPRQINALKAIQYVDGARMRFRIKVLGDTVSQEDLELVFAYGCVHGYAGERSDGEGRYAFSVEKE